MIPQSFTQLRYVGKIGGLYPSDPIEAAFADAAMDAVMDIHIPMRAFVYEKDDQKKVKQVTATQPVFIFLLCGSLHHPNA